MAEYIEIPKDRVGVLVGKEGAIRAMLEKRCKVKLEIKSEGGVSIMSPSEDGLAEWKALDIVKAIGRGFNPKYAVLLLKDDYALSIINLYDILHQKDSDVTRVKSRIIGEAGKARSTLETLTRTKISVYGRTVAILGTEGDVQLAEKAISMLIKGAQHATVYRIIEGDMSGKAPI